MAAHQADLQTHFGVAPSHDALLDSYRCSLRHGPAFAPGRLYVTPTRVYFFSSPSIKILLPFAAIAEITRETTMMVIPDAIAIRPSAAGDDTVFLASFEDRNAVFSLLDALITAERARADRADREAASETPPPADAAASAHDWDMVACGEQLPPEAAIEGVYRPHRTTDLDAVQASTDSVVDVITRARSSSSTAPHTTHRVKVLRKGAFVVKTNNLVGAVPRKKYAYLEHLTLVLYDTPDRDREPWETIDLAHAHVLPATATRTEPGSQEFYSTRAFDLFTPAYSYSCTCDSEADMKNWVAAITKDIDDASLLLSSALVPSLPEGVVVARQGYLLTTLHESSRSSPSPSDPFGVGTVVNAVMTPLKTVYDGAKRLFIRPANAKLHWARLQDSRLVLFADSSATTVVDEIELARSRVDLPDDYEHHGTFSLASPSSVYTFRAPNVSDTLYWTLAIRRVAKSLAAGAALEGHLVKRATRPWQSHREGWYVVRDGFFSTYRDHKAHTPDARVNLFGASVRAATGREDPRGFVLTKSGADEIFWARNRKEAQEWVSVLGSAIQQAKAARAPGLHEGYLYKDPQIFLSRARHRWFILRPGALFWYARPSDSEPLGSMEMEEADVTLTPSSETDFSFILTSPSRNYLMVAPNRDEQLAWVSEIQKEINRSRMRKLLKAEVRDRSHSCPPRYVPAITPSNDPEKIESHVSPTKQWRRFILFSVGEDEREADRMPPTANDALDDDINNNTAAAAAASTTDFEPVLDPRRRCSLPQPIRSYVPPLPETLGTVALDNGSYTLRAGFAVHEYPRAMVPCSPAYARAPEDERQVSRFYNDSPLCPRVTGVQPGDWDHMASIWGSLLSGDLAVDPQDWGLCMSEPFGLSISGRSRILEIVFEELQSPVLSLQSPCVMALLASGRDSGCIVNWGSSLQVLCVSNGYLLPGTGVMKPFGGGDLDTLLLNMLRQETGLPLDTPAARAQARDWKEQYCYVAHDFDAQVATVGTGGGGDLRLKLSSADGRMVSLGPERFICAETLFKPTLVQKDIGGIHELVAESIAACDIDLRRPMYESVVVSGGTALMRGFRDRLQKELEVQAGAGTAVDVHQAGNSRFATWQGLARFANSDSYHVDCWHRSEYAEYGESLAVVGSA